MRYAMIETNDCKVIEIVDSEETPYFPPLPDGTEIQAVECDEMVYRGLYYIDGEFIEITPESQPEPELSATEQAILETQANTEYLVALSELA